MKKKLLSLILAAVMVLGLSTVSRAAEAGNYAAEAQQLKILNVFQGTSNGFELTRQPTRLEGLIMLIRLLGVEKQAQAMGDKACVFTDVSAFGRGYVNYAYQNGLTRGVDSRRFGSGDQINALGYTTFLLRALGYSDSGGDFTYAQSIAFARQIGLYSAADAAELTQTTFLRDQVARTSMLALGTKVKAGGRTLLQKLAADGAVSQTAAAQINPEAFAGLEVRYLDVGQADSILIRKGSHAMLIDGGNVGDGDAVVSRIKEADISTLDYVIATHPHEDHIGGLTDVIKSLAVKTVIMPDAVTTTSAYQNLLSAIAARRLTITRPVYGASYDLGGAAFTILAPNSADYEDLNNNSVVLKLVNGTNSFLFTGDAGTLSESEMLAKDSVILKSDVLKVGHHGSSTSTSQKFLNAVSPAYAVVSVGAGNDYGLPDQEVLDRLTAKGVRIFRTDEQGTITASSNGHTIAFDQSPAAGTGAPSSTGTGTVTGGAENASQTVVITKVDKEAELVTLKNTGPGEVSLSGWRLVSVTGNQTYTFPAYTLKAGAQVTVASGKATGDLEWTTSNIWNNTGSDPAQLYNAAGNLVSSYAA